MKHLPLWARLALLSAGAMLLLQAVALGVLATRDEGFDLGAIRPSFARQVAGMARLFDRMAMPARRQIALEILNAGAMRVALADTVPTAADAGPVLGYWAKGVARKITAEGVPPERLLVRYVTDTESDTGPLARLVGRHLQIVIALRTGDYLVISPDADANNFLFGTIILVIAGVLGLVVVGIVVFAIYRQTRPLGTLAVHMERFAQAAVPTPMEEQGAPELRALIRSTNAMQNQIAALIRNRAIILAGMSHDLRTLVTKLRLRLELLPASEARERAIADIEAMQAMTEETLAFASAGSAADGGVADLTKIVGQVFDVQSLATPGRVTWAGGTEALRVSIGEASLRRIVQNLVDNAIAYGGQAEISVARTGDTARLVVGDRGPGIPDSQKAEIFEPYVRLETSRNRQGGGTGLGLAIVKQIADRHHGRVEVVDRPGGGSLFTVTLPLA